jgi:hypothetical protein
MKESTQRHMINAAAKFMRGVAGQTCVLDWRASHTGTWDARRKEYSGGSDVRGRMDNVPCLVFSLDAKSIRFGDWGNAQVGDLVMAFDNSLDLEDFNDLKVYYRHMVYRPVPNSTIPTDELSALVGDTQVYRVLHCRYEGAEAGVI